MPHIVYLATADARGHLMRAQLLVHGLRAAGAQVEALTTSDAGQAFLQEFGIEAQILSRHYGVQFDAQQNMLRGATDSNVAHYVFRPGRMLRDIASLSALFRTADLVINDSFHPALLFMGAMPHWRRKVVHVYGASLRQALISNFEGRLPCLLARGFAGIVNWQIDSARCCIAHDFAYSLPDTGPYARAPRLPTPVVIANERAFAPETVAVYMNPHFRDLALADALVAGLSHAGRQLHLVGEGFAGHGDWVGVDADWVSRAARAPFIVSAPGMAALSVALVYERPILLVLTDQPEQARNAVRASELGLRHEVVVWRGDAQAFSNEVACAASQLMCAPGTPAACEAGRAQARARLKAWVDFLLALGAEKARH